MKQKLTVKQGILSKNKQNAKKINKLLQACINLYDYKVLCYLLAENSFQIDSQEFNIEAFVHRLGKLTDIQFEEENKEKTHANIVL